MSSLAFPPSIRKYCHASPNITKHQKPQAPATSAATPARPKAAFFADAELDTPGVAPGVGAALAASSTPPCTTVGTPAAGTFLAAAAYASRELGPGLWVWCSVGACKVHRGCEDSESEGTSNETDEGHLRLIDDSHHARLAVLGLTAVDPSGPGVVDGQDKDGVAHAVGDVDEVAVEAVLNRLARVLEVGLHDRVGARVELEGERVARRRHDVVGLERQPVLSDGDFLVAGGGEREQCGAGEERGEVHGVWVWSVGFVGLVYR